MLIMNNFKVKNKRKDMRFEINFTNTYREAKRRFSHPARLNLNTSNANILQYCIR